ncbi:MAG: gluconate 2-dehydrogenase subunit 3 family protein [Nitrospiraceae bacterium]
MPDITRRRFGVWTVFGALCLGVSPPTDLLARSAADIPAALPPDRILAGPFRALSPYEATVLEEVTALLIPTDQEAGAREAGIVTSLDAQIAADAAQLALYRQGLAWLDWLASTRSGQESFLLLPRDSRIEILTAAERGTLSRIEQLKEWWRFGERGSSVRFFDAVRLDTLAAFYSRREGWRVAGYQGPPQFTGYPNYARCE